MKVQRVDLTTERGMEFLAAAKLIDKECIPNCRWYPVDFLWVVLDNVEVVGYAGLVENHPSKNCGYICRVGIIPSHRGYGMQKRLTRVICRLAKKLGWKGIVSDTWKNPPSANSFIACGFKTYQPPNPWAFNDSIYWRKIL